MIKKLYINNGNLSVVNSVNKNSRNLLDVGCGAGDNAKLLRKALPDARIFGITHSKEECNLAKRYLDDCFQIDLDAFDHIFFNAIRFDCLIFSHVLEHLKYPLNTLNQLSATLNAGGQIVIALPNVLFYKQRLKFLFGYFEYEKFGIMDETHLRFFTYDSVDEYFVKNLENFQLISKTATGNFPLWFLRRYKILEGFCCKIDTFFTGLFPNLFGFEILLILKKNESK